MNTVTLTPAYGRDYTSKASALEAWDGNKDFQMHHMGLVHYVNKPQADQLKAEGFTHAQIRYGKMQKGFILPL